MFWMIQYVVPTASVPDCLMAIRRSSPPMLAPITSLTIFMSVIGMFSGLHRAKLELKGSNRRFSRFAPNQFTQTLWGTFYMLHWIPIMVSTTARMSVRPKRLKWVKTVHHGGDDVFAEGLESS